MSVVCEHGNAKRKCELCERDERIVELEGRIDDLKACIRKIIKEEDSKGVRIWWDWVRDVLAADDYPSMDEGDVAANLNSEVQA